MKTASIPKLKKEISKMLSNTFKTIFVIFIPAKDFQFGRKKEYKT